MASRPARPRRSRRWRGPALTAVYAPPGAGRITRRAAVPRVAARRRHRTMTPSSATATPRPPRDAAAAVQPAGERHVVTRFARAESGLPTVTAAAAGSGPPPATRPAAARAGRAPRVRDRPPMALRRPV